MDLLKNLEEYIKIFKESCKANKIAFLDLNKKVIALSRPVSLSTVNIGDTVVISSNYSTRKDLITGSIITAIDKSLAKLINEEVALDDSKATFLLQLNGSSTEKEDEYEFRNTSELLIIPKDILSLMDVVPLSDLYNMQYKLVDVPMLFNKVFKNSDKLDIYTMSIKDLMYTTLGDELLKLCEIKTINLDTSEINLYVTLNQYYPWSLSDNLEIPIDTQSIIKGISINKLNNIIYQTYQTYTKEEEYEFDLTEFEAHIKSIDYEDFYYKLNSLIGESTIPLGRPSAKTVAKVISSVNIDKLSELRCFYLEGNLTKQSLDSVMSYNDLIKVYKLCNELVIK